MINGFLQAIYIIYGRAGKAVYFFIFLLKKLDGYENGYLTGKVAGF